MSVAAEAMHVSQPTVSVNMRKLEEEHGVALFTRSSRGVVLTQFGRVLYEHVRVMSRLDEHAAAEIRALKRADRPSLKVACGFAWWPLFVRKVVKSCAEDSPEAAMHVDICSSLDGLRHLLSGDVGCFIGTMVENLSDTMAFAFEPLFDVEDAFFARRHHPLQGRDIKRQDLADYPRLDVAPFVNRHFGIADPAPETGGSIWASREPARLSSNSMTSGICMLQDSDAFLIYPMQISAYFASQGIDMLSVIDRPRHKVAIGIYTLAEKEPSSEQSRFLDRVRAAVRG